MCLHKCCSHVRIADDAFEVTASVLEGHTPCVSSAREIGNARGATGESGVSNIGTPEVAAALTDAPELASRRAMVEAAGCELQPAWAGGMWTLLPLTPEQFQEAGLRTTS